MKPIEPGTRYGKRVVFGAEPILRKTHKIRGLWMRCDCGREDLVDRYQVTRGLASQCLDCQKVEQSLRMEAKWAKRKGELMIDRELLKTVATERDQLRAEVEASRLLLEQCNEVIAEDGGVYIELRAFLAETMPASDVIALLRDAAMAAKDRP